MKSSKVAKVLLQRYLSILNSYEGVMNIRAQQPKKKLLFKSDDMTLLERLRHCSLQSDDWGPNNMFTPEILTMALCKWQSQPKECMLCFGLTPEQILDMFN